MIVREMFDKMQSAVEAGDGDLPLVIIDGSSGVSYGASCHGEPHVLDDDGYDAGFLCDEEPGFEYVPIYTD